MSNGNVRTTQQYNKTTNNNKMKKIIDIPNNSSVYAFDFNDYLVEITSEDKSKKAYKKGMDALNRLRNRN